MFTGPFVKDVDLRHLNLVIPWEEEGETEAAPCPRAPRSA